MNGWQMIFVVIGLAGIFGLFALLTISPFIGWIMDKIRGKK